MVGWIALAIAIVVMAGAAALAIGATRRATSPRVLIMTLSDGTLTISTPRGKGRARIVLHEDMGRCYAIDLRLRGEKPAIDYVPPAEHLVRLRVTQRLEALDH